MKNMHIEILGARGETGSSDEFLNKVRSIAANGNIEILAINPMAVCGKEHIHRAIEMADAAIARKANRSDSLLIETLLFLTARRQISEAASISKVNRSDKQAVFALIDKKDVQPDIDGFLDKIGMKKDDSLLEPSIEKLEYIGISRDSIDTAIGADNKNETNKGYDKETMNKNELETNQRAFDLIFEKMALSAI